MSAGLLRHASVLHHRTHLDATPARTGDLGRDLDRFVQVLRIEQVVAAELLARLGERAVGRRDLAVAYAHGRRRRRGLERPAGHYVPALLIRAAEGEVLAEFGVGVRFGQAGPGLLVLVDEAEVFHRGRLRVVGRLYR